MIRPTSLPSAALPAVLLLFALGACTSAPAPSASSPPPHPPSSATVDCGAEQLGAYVGREASEDVLRAIRTWRGDKPVRVLKPGSAMTMDYRPDRLNVFLDDTGRIAKFACN